MSIIGKGRYAALLLACGFFAATAQSILFREFLVVFDGNEIGITAFFSSWLVWVFLGALSFRRLPGIAGFAARRAPLLLLAHLPLFALQWFCIVNIRRYAAIGAYETISMARLVVWTVVFNAPVSFVTGALFPAMTGYGRLRRWRTSIAHVFGFESAGGVLAGATLTILLMWGVHWSRVVALAGVLVVFATAYAVNLRRERIIAGAAAALFACIAVAAWLLSPDAVFSYKLSRAHPDLSFKRGISLHDGELIHASRGSQDIIVYNGLIQESFPDRQANAALAAVILAQRPTCRRVLVIGPRAGLARAFSDTPGIERVYVWHTDPAYFAFALDALGRGNGRISVLTHDPFPSGGQALDSIDAVVLAVGDPLTGSHNRFYTVEYLERLAAGLADNGIVLVRISGMHTYAGADLVRYGQSVYQSCDAAFDTVIVKPGRDTWFIAARGGSLTANPHVLADRYKRIPAGERLFPQSGFYALFNRERAIRAEALYQQGKGRERDARNTIHNPVSYRYSLLMMGARTDAVLTGILRRLFRIKPAAALYAAIAAVALMLAVSARSGAPPVQAFACRAAVGLFGAWGMMISLILLYAFEASMGSLFIFIGLMTAAYMLGLALGSLIVRRVRRRPLFWLVAGGVCACGFSAGLSLGGTPPAVWLYLLLSAVAGALGGALYAASAHMIDKGFISVEHGASMLEGADHVGGALGGIVAGLLLIPLFGFSAAALLTALVPATAVALLLIDTGVWSRRDMSGRAVWFGAAAAWIVILLGIVRPMVIDEETERGRLRRAVHLLGLEQTSIALIGDAYAETRERGARSFVFLSSSYAPRVHGYGGPLDIAIRIQPDGTLLDFVIVDHSETPEYLARAQKAARALIGRSVYRIDSLDGVSGATLSAAAVESAIVAGGESFLRRVVSNGDLTDRSNASRGGVPAAVYVILMIAAAVIIDRTRHNRLKVPLFVVSVVMGGFVFNAVYAFEHVAVLAKGEALSGSWISIVLSAGVPAAVVLAGNVYCRFVCPFGAGQELLGRIPGARRLIRRGGGRSQLRFFILFIILGLFLIAGNGAILGFDFLPGLFRLEMSRFAASCALAALALNVVFPRLWCRAVCPAGAFLSLCACIGPRTIRRRTATGAADKSRMAHSPSRTPTANAMEDS